MSKNLKKRPVKCIDNKNYKTDLILNKTYFMIPEETDGTYIRVIDESGEDYLYCKDMFKSLDGRPIINKKLLIKNKEKIMFIST